MRIASDRADLVREAGISRQKGSRCVLRSTVPARLPLRHVSSAYLTYVAVDKDGKGILVPKVVPVTEHQKRRYEDAGRRREMRGEETMRKREMRMALGEGWHL